MILEVFAESIKIVEVRGILMVLVGKVEKSQHPKQTQNGTPIKMFDFPCLWSVEKSQGNFLGIVQVIRTRSQDEGIQNTAALDAAGFSRPAQTETRF